MEENFTEEDLWNKKFQMTKIEITIAVRYFVVMIRYGKES